MNEQEFNEVFQFYYNKLSKKQKKSLLLMVQSFLDNRKAKKIKPVVRRQKKPTVEKSYNKEFVKQYNDELIEAEKRISKGVLITHETIIEEIKKLFLDSSKAKKIKRVVEKSYTEAFVKQYNDELIEIEKRIGEGVFITHETIIEETKTLFLDSITAKKIKPVVKRYMSPVIKQYDEKFINQYHEELNEAEKRIGEGEFITYETIIKETKTW